MSNQTLKSNFLWNTFGTLFYFATQWLLMLIVVKIEGGYVDNGLLTMCLAIGNVGFTIAAYSIRAYQITDTAGKFSSSDYISHRLINCAITFIGILIFCMVKGYSPGEFWAIMAYLLFKVFEAISDVLHGIAQKNDRMDIIGKSFLMKGALTFIVFSVSYYLWESLLVSILGMVVVSGVVMILYDYKRALRFGKLTLSINKAAYASLLIACFSLFIFGVSANLIPAILRLYLEGLEGKEILGKYASIAIPATIIQVGINYLYAPLITMFTKFYNELDKRFYKLMFGIFALILAFGAVALVLAHLVGEQVLVMLFTPEIAEYSSILFTIIIVGLQIGLAWFIFSLLVIMRRTRSILMISLIGIISSVPAAMFFVNRYGIYGVNYALMVAFGVMCLYGLAVIFYDLSRRRLTGAKEGS